MQTKTQIDPKLISFSGKNKNSLPLHLLSRLCNEEAYSVGGHLNMCVFHSVLIVQIPVLRHIYITLPLSLSLTEILMFPENLASSWID